jgi:rod shape-determining protein MreC
MPRRKMFFFLVVVVFSFVLMTYQSRKGHTLSVGFTGNLLNSIDAATESVTDAIKRPFRMIALRDAENTALKKRVRELLLEREKYREAMLENKRLRELLGLKERHRDYVATARVIARGIDNWAHTFLLDKGSADGIAKDMTAITPRGLAGKIASVTGSYSRLLLLNDINFSTSVRLQDSRREGVLSGTGTRRCVLKYVSFDEPVKAGEIVITSGLDMLFPAGIPIGYVSKVGGRAGESNFQYIEVQPFQDSAEMEEVTIVK